MTVLCVRCGRSLRNPVYIGDTALGSTCARTVIRGVRIGGGARQSERRARRAMHVAQPDQYELFEGVN